MTAYSALPDTTPSSLLSPPPPPPLLPSPWSAYRLSPFRIVVVGFGAEPLMPLSNPPCPSPPLPPLPSPWSAYRLSPFRLVVVGFGADALRRSRVLKGCSWAYDNGTVLEGVLRIRFLPTDFKKVVRDPQGGLRAPHRLEESGEGSQGIVRALREW